VPLQSTSIAFQSNKLLVKVTLAICLSVIGSVLFGNFIFTFGKKKGIYKVLRNKRLDQNKTN